MVAAKTGDPPFPHGGLDRRGAGSRHAPAERAGQGANAEPAPIHVDEFNKAAKKPIDLMAEFERASGSGYPSGLNRLP
jgi:hypothetical protein